MKEDWFIKTARILTTYVGGVLLLWMGVTYAAGFWLYPTSTIAEQGIAAFGFTGGLAGLAYALSAIAKDSVERHRVNYAAERLIHAALIFFFALLFRHVIDMISGFSWIRRLGADPEIVSGVLNLPTAVIVVIAMRFAINGVTTFNDVLWIRYARAANQSELESETKDPKDTTPPQ